MIVFPNAKINLGLHIIDKRSDGYHNIETVFYPVQWNDILEIVPSNVFQFTSSGIEIPGNSDENLCVKAYNLLKKDFDIPPVKIHLHKIVPIGAGLGGGSSDAAFTIKLLNEKFKLSIAEEKLEKYAAQLGSDCAFFIANKPVFAFEKGDQWKNINLPNLENFNLVIVYPQINVSTFLAFQNVKKRGKSEHLYENYNLPLIEWQSKIENDFENSIFPFHPILSKIKAKMLEKGALYSAMSGSGSSVFGIFPQEQDVDQFKESDYLVWAGKMSIV